MVAGKYYIIVVIMGSLYNVLTSVPGDLGIDKTTVIAPKLI